MELTELLKDKDVKDKTPIGEPVIVLAVGGMMEFGGDEMTSRRSIIHAIKRDAPADANYFKIGEEVNAGENIYKNQCEFEVQYYK